MFLKVANSSGNYTFDFWGHTENGKLTLGSGLFVSSTGVACDHHFNPRTGSDDILFVSGDYHIEVWAKVIGRSMPDKLLEVKFIVTGNQTAELIQMPTRVLFLLWNADNRNYEGFVEQESQGDSVA